MSKKYYYHCPYIKIVLNEKAYENKEINFFGCTNPECKEAFVSKTKYTYIKHCAYCGNLLIDSVKTIKISKYKAQKIGYDIEHELSCHDMLNHTVICMGSNNLPIIHTYVGNDFIDISIERITEEMENFKKTYDDQIKHIENIIIGEGTVSVNYGIVCIENEYDDD